MFDLNSLISYVALLVLGGISWFTYKVYIWPYYISPLRNIPGPPSESLYYGNFKRFLVEEAGEPFLRWVKEYGSFLKYHTLFNKPMLLITDAKMLQEIMLNKVYEFRKPAERMADAERFMGQGLFLVEGDDHKRQRKMMHPAFTHHNIKDMTPTIIRVAFTLKGLIEDEVNKGGSRINLTPYILKTTMDIIGSVGFNNEFNSLTSPSELAEAYHTIMNAKKTTLSTIIAIFSYYIPSLRKIPININKKFNYAVEVIDREAKKIVDEKSRDDKLQGKDLLSLLIKINQTLPIEEKLTDDELKYQIMTFLLAGHDTTANGTSWALYLLAKHPHEQDLLREELVKAFPDKSKFNPTFDEINSLEYLNCIVKETLRLFPPVITILRTSSKDQILGEHFIPKNTLIGIPFYALHRLPSIWGPTADEFVPKRWLDPSSIQGITNYNYFPFSTGVRSCIGNKLALNEMKILVSLLVRNLVFQTVEGLQIKKKTGFLSKVDPNLELVVTKVEA